MSTDYAAIARVFREALPADGVSLHRIDGLDRVGVPVAQSNLTLPGKTVTTGHGYGFVPDEASVGALGELCEEALCGAYLAAAPTLRASHASLRRERGDEAAIDPLTLCLPAGSTYEADTPLDWIEGRCWPDGAPVLVPADAAAAHAYQLARPPALFLPITNGLGAGLDPAHAIAHGVMELLQRDGNVVGYRALDQGVVVELDAVGDDAVRDLLARLRDRRIDVTVKLATTEFGIANLYVVGNDRGTPSTPLQVTACGEAAHPDRERALRKALLEFCGSRARKTATHGEIARIREVLPDAHVDAQLDAARPDEEEARALGAMAEWLDQDAPTLRARLADTVFAERSRVAFSSLPHVGADAVANSDDRLRLLGERLGASGLSIVVVDCAPSGGAVRAVKVIVPGLEAETMSYGRLGWRVTRRLRDRDDPLILDRPRDGARRVRLRPEDEERAGGPAWFDWALAERIVGSLYPLYREPGCFSAQLHRARRRAA